MMNKSSSSEEEEEEEEEVEVDTGGKDSGGKNSGGNTLTSFVDRVKMERVQRLKRQNSPIRSAQATSNLVASSAFSRALQANQLASSSMEDTRMGSRSKSAPPDSQHKRSASNSSTVKGTCSPHVSNSPSKTSKTSKTSKASKAAPVVVELSEDDKLKLAVEDRKQKMQLYVFAVRCVSYPFNCKQPEDLAKRPLKVTPAQLEQLLPRFVTFLKGTTTIMADEAFHNAVQNYYTVYLSSDRIAKLVKRGGCSHGDLRDLFRTSVQKRVMGLPSITGLSKDTVLTSWLTKYDCICKLGEEETKKPARFQKINSEMILSKEQLYDMLQQVLGIKKFEHQILSSLLQLDSADEQAAAIRRELDGRLQRVAEMELNKRLLPKFLLKEMDSIFIQELKLSINSLMVNLESVPVSKPTTDGRNILPRFTRYGRSQSSSTRNVNDDEKEVHLTKSDVALNFHVEIIVIEGTKIRDPLNPTKVLYCTIEIDGGEKLQTDEAEATKATYVPSGYPADASVEYFLWDTQADFVTTTPLPTFKIKLYADNPGVLSLDDKELGRVVLNPTATSSKAPEWYDVIPSKEWANAMTKLKIICRMEKPLNLKHCGTLYAHGKNLWRKWKPRFFALVQVSQYTFAMCNYLDKKSEPASFFQLDGFTIDYVEHDCAQMMTDQYSYFRYCKTELTDGKYYFNAIKEGESFVFSTDDENECNYWVMALYRATGQSHKPTPIIISSKQASDADRAKQYGVAEYIAADSTKFDHHRLFRILLNSTLNYRLSDANCSLGWLSPGQLFSLDEYCARYGVRTCLRHLYYMDELLKRSEEHMIDPHLIHISYAYCVSHVHGNGTDGVSTVLYIENELFNDVKERLVNLLERNITYFRDTYPFGKPEGGLKATISLLERVLMKDVATPALQNEFRASLNRCLEQAALHNYTKLSREVLPEDFLDLRRETAKERLEEIVRLTEQSVELIQQNNEYYVETCRGAFSWFSGLMVEHTEKFWSLLAVDMEPVVLLQPENFDIYPIFQMLNDYLSHDSYMRNGVFHRHIRDMFKPFVEKYIEVTERAIVANCPKAFDKENYEPQGNSCGACEDLLHRLDSLHTFIVNLNWPEEEYRLKIEQRINVLSRSLLTSTMEKVETAFHNRLSKITFVLSFNIDTEMCVMLNSILESKNQAFKLCTIRGYDIYMCHRKIEETLDEYLNSMSEELILKLNTVLLNLLSKLSRHSDGSLVGSFLSLTNFRNAGKGKEQAQEYLEFTRTSTDRIRIVVNDELWIVKFFEQWYNSQLMCICNWLSEKQEGTLNYFQCSCISHVLKKLYTDFELQGVVENKLDTPIHEKVCKRMKREEATCSLRMSAQGVDMEALEKHSNSGPSKKSETDEKNKTLSQLTSAASNVVGKVGDVVGGLSSKFKLVTG